MSEPVQDARGEIVRLRDQIDALRDAWDPYRRFAEAERVARAALDLAERLMKERDGLATRLDLIEREGRV